MNRLVVCPDCGSSLGKTAYKCRCGWKGAKTTEAFLHIQCAFVGCGNSAMVRVKDGNATVNLCVSCYPRWWTPERIKGHNINRGEHDNHTMAEIRKAFMSSRYMENVRSGGVDAAKALLREPGEDDEALAA